MTFLAIMGGLAAAFGFVPADGGPGTAKGPTCVMLGGSGLAVVAAVAVASVMS